MAKLYTLQCFLYLLDVSSRRLSQVKSLKFQNEDKDNTTKELDKGEAT